MMRTGENIQDNAHHRHAIDNLKWLKQYFMEHGTRDAASIMEDYQLAIEFALAPECLFLKDPLK